MILESLHNVLDNFLDLRLEDSTANRASVIVALLSDEIKYRILVEHIPAITYIAAMDEQSSTLYTSPQIERILGISQTEWMADQQLWLKQIHPDDRAFVLKDLARIKAGGRPEPCEYRMLTRDGSVRWFLDKSAFVHDSDGCPLVIYGVMIDITEKRQLEEKLAEAEYQLEESRKPRLSDRELAVLQLIHNHYTTNEIAHKLAMAERTVRYCLKKIYDKMNVKTRREALKEARRLRLLEM